MPGTPADSPLVTASANGIGTPFSTNASSCIVGRRRLPAVDRVDLAGRGVVVDEEAAAADAGTERLGDAERGGRCHRGIDRVAALAEHVKADARRVGVDRSDGPAEPIATGCLSVGRGWAPAEPMAIEPPSTAMVVPTAARRTE